MSTRERLRQKAKGWVKRAIVMLPETGELVQVRGLVAGELNRLGSVGAEKRLALQTALAAEDPETGEPLWNPNLFEDVQEIDALPGPDILAISEAVNRLSGQGEKAEEMGKGISQPERSSIISFPTASESSSAPSESSALEKSA